MPDIYVQHTTFERLQAHAKPLVDTADSVIVRALDALEADAELNGTDVGAGMARERLIDPRSLPDLTHTRVRDASVEGLPVAKPVWNLILVEILRQAAARAGDFDALQKSCQANIVKGCKDDDGYHYLQDLDISLQGQSANGACRSICALAMDFDIRVEVGFSWRHKAAAAYPGEVARLRV